MNYLAALLIFILVYVIVDFLLKRVPPLTPVAEVLAIVAGAFAALIYIGVLH